MGSYANPRRYYLLSYPRTASSLLLKILAPERQPNVSTGDFSGGYFFFPAALNRAKLGLQGRNVDDWTDDEAELARLELQKSFNSLQQHLDSAESQGHTSFVKEHTIHLADPTAISRLRFDSVNELPWTVGYEGALSRSHLNCTVLSDEFLLTWLPIFLIRHPALAFPSYYRAIVQVEGKEVAEQDDYARLIFTLDWTRSLFDFYYERRQSLPCSDEQRGQWPVVIDADDIMTNPTVMIELCDRMGMDSQQLRFDWEQTRPQDTSEPENMKIMHATLDGSTGILQGKTAEGVNLDTEVGKWRTEFGKTTADHIEKHVRKAMPHYKYLRSKRLVSIYD